MPHAFDFVHIEPRPPTPARAVRGTDQPRRPAATRLTAEQQCSRIASTRRTSFRYSEPVPVDELIDRDTEAALLLRRASEGNNSRLVAPRRFGKTSLLRRALHDAEREGWAAVYVDFFGVLTLTDIAQRIERAYSEQLPGRLASWFSGVRRMLRPTVRAGGGPVPGAVEVTVDAQAEPPLLERLALPRRLHERHGQRTLVVFDEFQDVLDAQERADAIIRSEIQHHGDAASYVFSGSHLGMMRELFADRRRAFYGQAGAIELPPRAIWTLLKPSQRRVLAAVAENTQRLYASDRRHGGSRGGAVRSAAKALEDRGEILRDEQAATGYRVTDPLLARWVRAGRSEA